LMILELIYIKLERFSAVVALDIGFFAISVVVIDALAERYSINWSPAVTIGIITSFCCR